MSPWAIANGPSQCFVSRRNQTHGSVWRSEFFGVFAVWEGRSQLRTLDQQVEGEASRQPWPPTAFGGLPLLASIPSDSYSQGFYGLVDPLGRQPAIAKEEPAVGSAGEQHRREGSNANPATAGLTGEGVVVNAVG